MLGIGAFVLDPALYIGGHAENSTCAFEVDRATMALQEPQNLLPLLTSEEQLLASHHWQSRPLPLHALDAACHESYGQRVLIAERFAVHEVRVSKNGSQLPPRRLQDVDLCLAQAPAFHSAGLAGVGLECSESGSCNVLLLAASGDLVLVCPIGSGEETRTPPQRQRQQQQRQTSVVLLGEGVSSAAGDSVARWRGLAAAATIQKGSKVPHMQHRWWMVRAAGISVPQQQLQPPTEFHVWRGFEGSLVAQQAVQTHNAQRKPPAQVPSSHAAVMSMRGAAATSMHHQSATPVTVSAQGSLGSLHVYNESTVLALDAVGGALHLWATSNSNIRVSADNHGMEVAGTWQLPPDRHWSSICALGNHLFAVASVESPAKGPELWHFPLPLDSTS